MDSIIKDLSGPMDWYMNLETWEMVFVGVFGVLGFYIAMRIVFKLVEKIAGLFG
jgi:hypothetical protein